VIARLDQTEDHRLSAGKAEVVKVARSELKRFKSKSLTPEQFDDNRFD
jgi:hypothetical protein